VTISCFATVLLISAKLDRHRNRTLAIRGKRVVKAGAPVTRCGETPQAKPFHASRGFAREESVHARVGLFGNCHREMVEPVGPAWVDREFGAVARGTIARKHEE
jgi:hypothetical protein